MTYNNTLEELVAAIHNDNLVVSLMIDNDVVSAYEPNSDDTVLSMHP